MSIRAIFITILLGCTFQSVCLAQATIVKKVLDACYTEDLNRNDVLGVIQLDEVVEKINISMWIDTKLGTIKECWQDKINISYPRNSIKINSSTLSVGDVLNDMPINVFKPERIIYISKKSKKYILLEMRHFGQPYATGRYAYYIVLLDKKNEIENAKCYEYCNNTLGDEELLGLVKAM